MTAFAFALVVLVVLVLAVVVVAQQRALDRERKLFSDYSRRVLNALVAEEPRDYTQANAIDAAAEAAPGTLGEFMEAEMQAKANASRGRGPTPMRPPGHVVGEP